VIHLDDDVDVPPATLRQRGPNSRTTRPLDTKHAFGYSARVVPLPAWELEIIRRSLTMSSTLPAEQGYRLLDEIHRLMEELRLAREGCCRDEAEESG
jgi:hypothetical protein